MPRAPATKLASEAPGGTAARWTSAPVALALIVVVALASRAVTFGNPLVIVDDQFYHFVGHAMLGGQWPYIDLWDRKPVGLFALFAAIAAIGGGSVIAMQLVAAGFAAATAWVLRHIALPFAGRRGALFAALAYLLTLPLFGGQSAQSPIFYNLLVAGAAALLIGTARDGRRLVARALAAMALCGLALIVKQSSVVEGAFIGLGFLWLSHRQDARLPRVAVLAAAMIAVALAPSLIAFLIYAVQGSEAREAYVFANFASIFLKTSHGATARLAGIGFFLIYMFPLAAAAVAGAVLRRRAGLRDAAATLLNGWMIAALLGYLAIPNFFDHYALPMIAPLAASAASLFAARSGTLYFGGLAIFTLMQGAMLDLGQNQRERAQFADADAVIRAAARGGCLFVINGPSQFYFSTPPCGSTAYIFPDHLATMVEETGIGVDQRAELGRVLAARPAVIAILESESDQRRGVMNRQIADALRAYRPVHYVPADGGGSPVETLRIWQRRDLPPPRTAARR